jgi:ATP-dependent helicase/DNAse subunit B
MPKLSVSSMGTYEKCPKKYHYRYIEKPEVKAQDWNFLEIGKFEHRVLELFHLEIMKRIVEPSEYSSLLGKCYKQALPEFKYEVLKKEIPEIRIDLQDYLDMIRAEGLPNVVACEKPYSIKIGEHTVHGFIDRIDKIDDDFYHVVDYKTSKNPKYLDSFQLIVYAIAIKEMYPEVKKVKGSYSLLKHKSKKLSWTFGEEDYNKAIDKILTIGENIQIGTKWEKKKSKLCDFCDYLEICQGKKIDNSYIDEDIFV